MAKRAPILPDNYNPVGERLRRLSSSSFATPKKLVELPAAPVEEEEIQPPKEWVGLREREPVPEIPTGIELKTSSVRFRCSVSERRKWHELVRGLCGDHNNLSHVIRAVMLLLENASEELLRLAPDVQRLAKPASTDSLGLTLYEQRLAQCLYDAIRGAGRPRY